MKGTVASAGAPRRSQPKSQGVGHWGLLAALGRAPSLENLQVSVGVQVTSSRVRTGSVMSKLWIYEILFDWECFAL